MSRRRIIAYQTPESGEAAGRYGTASFVLAVAAACLLFTLVLSVRHRWVTNWQPLLLIVVFVVSMLGLIAVPTAHGSSRRSAVALAALLINATCLASLLGLVLLFGWVGNAG